MLKLTYVTKVWWVLRELFHRVLVKALVHEEVAAEVEEVAGRASSGRSSLSPGVMKQLSGSSSLTSCSQRFNTRMFGVVSGFLPTSVFSR